MFFAFNTIMPPSRAYVRKNMNEGQQAPQTREDPLNEQVSHAKFWDAFQVLSQYMAILGQSIGY